MNLKSVMIGIAGVAFCLPAVFAEPMFVFDEVASSSNDNDDAPPAGIEGYQLDPDDIPGPAVATDGPDWDPVSPDAPEGPRANVQVLNINRDAYLGQLKRMGWRDYDVVEAEEPPSIMLANNQEVVLENDQLIVTGDDNAVVVANAVGSDEESLLFIDGDSFLGGELVVDGRFFELRPGRPDPSLTDLTIEAIEVNEWVFHDEAETHGVEIEELEAGDATAEEPAAAGINRIDVMVVYPSSLRDSIPRGAVGAEIKLAVEYANYSYRISGINQRINLVHVQALDYEEDGDIDTDLMRLVEDNDGHMDDVFDLWKDKKADIVSLWVGRANYPGVAFTMKDVNTGFAPCAVNVVRWPDAKRNYSFIHELGHNMGARHDIRQTSENLPFAHAHGYVYGRLVSVMAYPKGSCNFLVCKRTPSFSNPDTQFGTLASADNRLTLNKTAATVSKFDSRHDLLGSCDL